MKRWKAGTLLATWIVYWLVLVGVTIGPGLLAAWRLARAPGSRGSMSLSMDDGRLLLDVHDKVTGSPWAFNTSLTTALLWVAIPPLALWLLWLVSRPRRPTLTSPADPLLAPPATRAQPAEQTPVERIRR